MDLAALKAELLTDPTALGYAPSRTAGDDVTLASVINAARAAITIRRADITPTELVNVIDVADYTALPASPTVAQLSTERRLLAWLSGAMAASGAIRLLNDDGTNAPAVANLQAMFPAGSGTRTRILALAVRQGSRAEQLFGVGTTIAPLIIAQALRG